MGAVLVPLLTAVLVLLGGVSSGYTSWSTAAVYAYDEEAIIVADRGAAAVQGIIGADQALLDHRRSAPQHGYDDHREDARASARPGEYRLAPRTAGGTANAAQGARLAEHLRLTERYGAGGVRELADGRIRYYGELTQAAKPGEMAGARLVREWSPATGQYRTWYETLDQAGQVRIVHPKQPDIPWHYWFDEAGNYGGRR